MICFSCFGKRSSELIFLIVISKVIVTTEYLLIVISLRFQINKQNVNLDKLF